jgi:hypothetical protein
MVKHVHAVALAIALALALGADVPRAQTPTASSDAPKAAQPAMKPGTPLQVQVVMSRFQGDKKVSSVPYALSVTAIAPPWVGRPSQLRIGAEVPVPAMSAPRVAGKPASDADPNIPVGGGPMTYRAFGTNIDCSAVTTGDGRFRVSLTVEDSSLYLDGQVAQSAAQKATDPPIMRSFRFSNEILLRDGQSAQFAAATDRVSGEIIKVDVTVTVVK